jgi:N-acetylglucosaminyldiphosphoundecaprenol N-acetyl-beta-D-mannosaminyltransferase
MSPYILLSRIDITSHSLAVAQIVDWAKKDENRIVFAADVHMVMEAYDSEKLRNINNAADLVTPDGMPLVWWLRMKGIKNQPRVYGPDLMLHVCQAAATEGIPVGLYGSTEEVIYTLLNKLRSRFPKLKINFAVSPPFRPVDIAEDTRIVQQINSSGTKILFIGLGCPKQEIWIAEHKGKVHAVMIAVGAAFQFHAGLVRQAPGWIQKLGFEWLFRLSQEPGRLWRRYIIIVPRFLFLMTREILLQKFGNNKG